VGHYQYLKPNSIITTINREIREFKLHAPAPQYAVFSPVTEKEFTEIDKIRTRHRMAVQFLFLTNERTLVVKFVVDIAHDIAHRGFVHLFLFKLSSMDLTWDIADLGRGRFSGLTGQKEADTALKPMSRPYITDWPTVVFECGVPESLERLKVDAKWWLENSEGAVGTVVIVTVSVEKRSLCAEMWELADVANPDATQTDPDPFITRATRTGGCKIIGETVTGDPLKISFQKTMLRDPNETLGEGDIVFDAKDFKMIARGVW
ncbi:hypothetical protein B9Z19DRAFT_930529, partial [Tuber borchii]